MVRRLALHPLSIVVLGQRTAGRDEDHTQHNRAKATDAIGFRCNGLYYHVGVSDQGLGATGSAMDGGVERPLQAPALGP